MSLKVPRSQNVNNTDTNKFKYNKILKHVYYLINDGTKIIKNSILNIKTIKKENEGFCYLDELGISYQQVDSNKCLKEICIQCCFNYINFNCNITLNNGDLLTINI